MQSIIRKIRGNKNSF